MTEAKHIVTDGVKIYIFTFHDWNILKLSEGIYFTTNVIYINMICIFVEKQIPKCMQDNLCI